ncbi:hypothetical protein [Streptomyces sp. NPDC004008]
MPASPTPPQPSRIAGADGLVLTEDHLFNLVDAAAPVTSVTRPPAPGRRLVAVGAGVVLAVFRSELEDNEPHVELEHWSFSPPEPEGEWEVHTEERLTVEAGRLTLASGVNALPAPHQLTVPPGPYRLGVWCQGRTEARAVELDAIDTGTFPQGVERWMVRLWPDR